MQLFRSASGESPEGRSGLAKVQKAPQSRRPAPPCASSQTQAASLGSPGPSRALQVRFSKSPSTPSIRYLCRQEPRRVGREVAIFTPHHPLSSLSSQREPSSALKGAGLPQRSRVREPRRSPGTPRPQERAGRPSAPMRPELLARPCVPLRCFCWGGVQETVRQEQQACSHPEQSTGSPASRLRTEPFCNPAQDWRTSRWGGLGTSGNPGDPRSGVKGKREQGREGVGEGRVWEKG